MLHHLHEIEYKIFDSFIVTSSLLQFAASSTICQILKLSSFDLFHFKCVCGKLF